jgi:DNA-binding IclR family transcriptional regulator
MIGGRRAATTRRRREVSMTTQPDDLPDPRRPSDLVRSVSRALSVLEVVGAAGGAMSAKAVARRTGLNLSTAYHLLRTLCWEGYLIRLPSGDYRLGGGVAMRYRELLATLAAPAPVRGVLDRLSARTAYTGYLGRLVDGQVAITDVVYGVRSPRVDHLVPGLDEVASATPLGQVLQGGAAGLLDAGSSPRLVIEDGRLRHDVSCAAVAVRRTARAEGESMIWGIGLTGPRGCFAAARPTLQALISAAEQLAGLRSVPTAG